MADEAALLPTVLIVDDDLGFVWWLGSLFMEAGCLSLPGLNCGEAAALTKRLGVEPDLIVLNPSLTGAPNLLQHHLQTKPQSKIVTIGPAPKELGAFIHIHAILERPSPNGPALRREWLDILRNLLRQVEAAAG
jgi:hypothetical protein